MAGEVYFDFVCPWCYVGHRRVEKARALFPLARQAVIHWRSYQLDPAAGAVPTGSAADAMRGWYPAAGEAAARMTRIVSAGEDEGLRLDLERALPVSTFDAHRLSHFAARHGLMAPMNERIFDAYHVRGLNIADHSVLLELATQAGLSRDQVCAVLVDSSFGVVIRDSRRRAQALGVSSVPTLIIRSGSASYDCIAPHHASITEIAEALAG